MSKKFQELISNFPNSMHQLSREFFWWRFSKFIDDDDAALLTDLTTYKGMCVALVSGKFRFGIQPNHIALFKQACMKSDIVICAFNSAKSLSTHLGYDPSEYLPDKDRAEFISCNQLVDFVCVFDEATPTELCKKLHPAYLIKGADWKDKVLQEVAYCGEVIFVEPEKDYHTTDIVGQ